MKDSGEENNAQELNATGHVISFSDGSKNEGETHNQCVDFSSPTPVKMNEPSRVKCGEAPVEELPKNYGILSEFYGCMISSLRMLKLRNRAPTFKNISCLVEILTGRKFLFTHIAQIKHILPEAVQIDKILIHDDKTKCMKPDMKITLLFDVVDDHCEESVFVGLSNLFSSRLRDFYVAHPEDTHVPEATLPEPFNQRSFTVQEDPVLKDLSVSRDTDTISLSHSPPFRRFFSKKAGVPEIEKTNLLSPLKSAGVINEENKKTMMFSDYPSEASIRESTPVKLASSGDIQLVETPVQITPLRITPPNALVLTCEDESKTTASQNCKQPSSTAKKSLDFYCSDGNVTKNSHKEITFCLSDLVLLIHKIFQSVNFCPITKEELLHKIILYNCEIDDRDEVEKQIEHLEKLVPDWFYKKLVSSGDVLYNVKKESDLNLVCERINII
ncbi:CDT1-like protein a, chloroplastic [Primulina tabacum]|uniref:CDT1-like protein a, chloroplastic n=1 Tax=Primulina tabacum TaxID=48773 RepID=UPI003F595871